MARYGAQLDLGSDSVRAFLRLLKEHGTVVDPTLATFEGMFTANPGEMSEGDSRMAARLPAQQIAARDDEVDQLYNQVYRELLTFMMADPGTIDRATWLLWVAHDLERAKPMPSSHARRLRSASPFRC